MGPGPAGIAQLEYLFSRLVCTTIPTPINIKAPERKGFTVLENGGFIEGF